MQKVIVLNEYSVPVKRPTKAFLFCKRGFDIVLALLLLTALMPVSLLIALVAAIDTKSCPLFFQDRVGRHSKLFTMIKFRTMSCSAPNSMPTYMLLDAEMYISRVGSFLRKYSLDEIPQLLNILMGDMSFVGPRPVVGSEEDLVMLRRRNGADIIRPGLTGLAQINGRDQLPVGKKAQLDRTYLDGMCVWEDLRILIITAVNVIKSKGILEGDNPEIAKVSLDDDIAVHEYNDHVG